MTTAHSLTWTLFLLAEHPSVMARLWDELSGAVADGAPANGCPHADGTLPKGEELTLLDRVIKESMRLLPASAYSQRVNMVPVRLGPFDLPRGTGIVFTPLVTHRLPEIYAEPERYLPDRWLTLRPSPYAYHPFGGGQRLCIGGPLAMASIRIALRMILSRYRLTLVPGTKVSAHIESTMLFPTHGMPMHVDPADGQFQSSTVGGNIHELVDLVEAPAFAAGDEAAQSIAPRRPR